MNKKLIIVTVIIIIISIGVGSWYFLFQRKSSQVNTNEIIPEEEISEEQMRQTIVSLYFYNESTQNLTPEGRLIDVKELVGDPYRKLMDLLIEGPQNTSLSKTIPEGTRINKAELKGEILYLDLSKEFIENHEGGEQKESATIYSIVNTMTNLTEVNAVKILIEGEENKAFKDNLIKFDDPFVLIKEDDNSSNL